MQSHGLYPARLPCPWDFPGKNNGVGCPFLHQGPFLTQGSNLCLPRWQAYSLQLSPLGSLWASMCVSCSVASSPCNLVDCSSKAPLPMEFSRQGSRSGLPFPLPGDLPDQETEPGSPALQVDSLPSEPAGNVRARVTHHILHFSLGLSLPAHLISSSSFFCSLILIASKFSFITAVKITHHQAI